MEHWHQPSIPPVKAEDAEVSRSSRVLSVTSGNIQTYALDTKEGVENRDPVRSTSLEQTDFKSAPSQYNSQILASNHQGSLQHLNARRQRHGNGFRHSHRPQEFPPRPYLTCKKYIKYITRQRFDSGKDGAPVWDAVTEEAFQEGRQPRRITGLCADMLQLWSGSFQWVVRRKPNTENHMVGTNLSQNTSMSELGQYALANKFRVISRC